MRARSSSEDEDRAVDTTAVRAPLRVGRPILMDTRFAQCCNLYRYICHCAQSQEFVSTFIAFSPSFAVIHGYALVLVVGAA